MAIVNIFSKRQKQRRGEMPDVFAYDRIPQELRVQIMYICLDALGRTAEYCPTLTPKTVLSEVRDILRREYGVLRLISQEPSDVEVLTFFLNESNTECVLDVIELLFRAMESFTGDGAYRYHAEPKITPEEAIDELNERFLEHGIGYQYASGRLIRKDSEFIHKEVIQPVLSLLNDKRYQGAHDEFLTAHEHYRHGRTKSF